MADVGPRTAKQHIDDPHLPHIITAIDRIRRAWPVPLSERQADILDEMLTLLCEDIAADLLGPAAVARALGERRPRITVLCEVCGQAFETFAQSGRQTPRYCSPSCKGKARYRRNKARAISQIAPQTS